MDIDNANAGTGDETVGQADANVPNTPAADAGASGEAPPSGHAEEADPLAAILPQPGVMESGTSAATAPGGIAGDIAVTPPEGFDIDSGVLDGFMKVAREGGLQQEQAQSLFDMHVAEQRRLAESFRQGILEQRDRINANWHAQCLNDPDYGGEKYQATCNCVTAAIRRFIPDPREQREFVDFYKDANLHNAHPMFRFIASVGWKTREAGSAVSDAAGDAKPLSLADGLYKGMSLK